jgi:hypothetical protein
VVRAAVPSEWNLELYYAHAYDPRDEPLLTYELRLRIQPTPTIAFRIRRLQSNLDQRLPGDPDDGEELEVSPGRSRRISGQEEGASRAGHGLDPVLAAVEWVNN